MSSSWGNSWLKSWGGSWGPLTSTLGGAPPVKKKRKSKTTTDELEHLTKPKQITDDEAKGMAAVYGAQMVSSAIYQAPEIDQEIEQESFLQPFDLPNGTFKEPGQVVDSLLIETEKEDDIALILAIIEAIG